MYSEVHAESEAKLGAESKVQGSVCHSGDKSHSGIFKCIAFNRNKDDEDRGNLDFGLARRFALPLDEKVIG